MPTKFLLENADLFADFLHPAFNECVITRKYPSCQTSSCSTNLKNDSRFKFSVYQCGFRKGFSAQCCLVAILEKWESCNDKGKSFGAVMTDRSFENFWMPFSWAHHYKAACIWF